MMTEIEITKRAIKLKRQTHRLIKIEIEDLGFRLSLLKLKENLERRISDTFDPALSEKLDCVIYLLEN